MSQGTLFLHNTQSFKLRLVPLTSSPRQCHSLQCCWQQWSSPMCCCHPVGSPPPLSDSPLQGRRQTDPKQHGGARIPDSYSGHTVQCISNQRPGTLYFSKESLTSSHWATMSLVCMLLHKQELLQMSSFKSSATSHLTSTEIEECTYFYCQNLIIL